MYTQYTSVRRATPVGDRPKDHRATIPKTGGHQPHNWQVGVRFNLTIVGGTHVVAAPSCAGLAFVVSEVAQGGTLRFEVRYHEGVSEMGGWLVCSRSLGLVFLKGSWDWAGPLQDHSEGARGWLMDPLAALCVGFSVE